MRVTFIDVGYGDAALFEMPDGYTVLLDGGGNLLEDFQQNAYRIRSVEYLRKQGITHLDAVIISHIHEDHVCGVEQILNELSTDCIYVPYPVEPFVQAGRSIPLRQDMTKNTTLYTKALNAYCHILQNAAKAGTPVRMLQAGEDVSLTPELLMHVLAPKPSRIGEYMSIIEQVYLPGQTDAALDALLRRLDVSSNGTSFLLKFEAEGTAFLMAADNCPRDWDEVPFFMFENVNVLKLPHHGQIDAIDEHYMSKMPLTHVITTASSDRRNNSANAAVYQRLLCMRPPEEAPKFLFTDERCYSPYFSQPDGFRAITLVVDSGKIHTEFIKF